MAKEQNEVVGAAFLAGVATGRRSYSRLAAGYERPPLLHKVPRCQIELDGTPCDPKTVQNFNGQPLYYVLDKAALEGHGTVSVFTTPAQAQQFRTHVTKNTVGVPHVTSEASDVGPSPRALPEGVTLGGEVTLHEHANYQGGSWTFWTHWGDIPDFTSVYPPFSYSINDLASSVNTSVKANPPGTTVWTVLHEHINFEGSQLWISNEDIQWFQEGPGLVRDLSVVGWNDVASSLSYQV